MNQFIYDSCIRFLNIINADIKEDKYLLAQRIEIGSKLLESIHLLDSKYPGFLDDLIASEKQEQRKKPFFKGGWNVNTSVF